MITRRKARDTLIAIELQHGDVLEFELLDGSLRTFRLEDTGAGIVSTTLSRPGVCEPGAKTVYRFWCDLVSGDKPVRLEREVGSQRSFYNHVDRKGGNNRWRGVRRWPDGSEWILHVCHVTELTVPEHVPLENGQQYALGAGVRVGLFEHSHFIFKIYDRGEIVMLDPWILFWQMYRDAEEG